jgi:polyhydroxybutyrate depolymerase
VTRVRRACLGIAVASLVVGVVVAPGGAGVASTRAAKCAGPGAMRTGVPAGITTRTVAVDGESRSYRIEVPAGYRPSRAAPLLFDFHGLGSNKEQQALYSRLEVKGGKAGYVVVTPDATGGAAKRWVPPPFAGTDVDFVRALLSTTEQELCIDVRRVFAAGMSSGAVFSTALACELPGTLAAIAPVAGVNAHAVCDPGTPPVAVLAFHGTADGVVPYMGGAFFSGVDASVLPDAIRDRVSELARLQARPVTDAVAQWAAFDGCSATPRTTKVSEDVTRTAYRGCRAGTAVVLDTVVQGGHTWPGGVDVARLGTTTHSIDASELIVRFFTAHPRRG